MAQHGEILFGRADLLRYYQKNLFDFHAKGRAYLERTVGKLSCHKGCAFCCYQKILVNVPDGALMYLHLKATEQWTAALQQRLVEADREMTHVPHGEWLPLRRACVMLKEQTFGCGTCRIYPVRPLACAAEFSVLEPANCATPGGSNVIGFRNDDMIEFFAHLDQSIMEALGEANEALTLPGAVLLAHAILEELPRPAVHSVSMDVVHAATKAAGSAFDETALDAAFGAGQKS